MANIKIKDMYLGKIKDIRELANKLSSINWGIDYCKDISTNEDYKLLDKAYKLIDKAIEALDSIEASDSDNI